MVNIVFTVVSLVVLVVAVVTKSQTASVLPNQSEIEVLSATSQESPTESSTPSPTLIQTNTPMPTATASATSKPTIIPTSGNTISDWIYTGQMSEKSVTESAVSFTTNDLPNIVTMWYKEKMNVLGFNTKSVIQTQSNAKVLNKIAGSGKNGSVSIEITKDSDSSPTHVTVTLDTSAVSGDVNVSINNSI